MPVLDLNKRIGIQDLGKWDATSDSRLDIRVTRGASFEVGVDGVALGILHELRLKSVEIDLQITFDPVDDLGRPTDFFQSLTGLSMLFSSARISIVSDESSPKFAAPAARLWRYVVYCGGEIGDGQERLVVIRDPDYALPTHLQQGASAKFPFPDAFNQLLLRMSKSLADNLEFSGLPTDEAVVNFLYEAALNSHEHGRFTAEYAQLKTIPSTIRGFTLEKYRFNSRSELNSRTNLSPEVRQYFERAWPLGRAGASFLAATVADVGPGIQNTLSSISQSEDDWDRLERAFLPGVTRKPAGVAKGLGEGLPNIVSSAQRLNALLLVCSGGLLGQYNLLSKQEGPLRLSRIHESPNKRGGTSLTLVWPVLLGRSDQGELFGSSQA